VPGGPPCDRVRVGHRGVLVWAGGAPLNHGPIGLGTLRP
jgi:hypothetical protein